MIRLQLFRPPLPSQDEPFLGGHLLDVWHLGDEGRMVDRHGDRKIWFTVRKKEYQYQTGKKQRQQGQLLLFIYLVCKILILNINFTDFWILGLFEKQTHKRSIAQ